VIVIAVALEMGGRDDSVVFQTHDGVAVDHPRIDDVLGDVAFHLGEECCHGHRAAGKHRGNVPVRQRRQAVAIVASERANLGHRATSIHAGEPALHMEAAPCAVRKAT
jgi:hypothetical protein